MRKAGTTVRVTAQLIDARTDKHLWSETYDRKLEDIFAIQDEISAHIVEALKVALGAGGEKAIESNEAPTDNLEAYENYLRGRYLWQTRVAKNIASAIELFEMATTLDPSFARAWSSLASAHITMPTYSYVDEKEHYALALSNAQKALALDPTIAEAHAVLADIARIGGQFNAAETHYQSAIQYEPKNSTSHLWYAEHLQATGRLDTALAEGLIAYRLDPLHPGTNDVIGFLYASMGDYPNAEKHLKQAIQLGHAGAIWDLAQVMIIQQRFEEAVRLARDFDVEFPELDGVAAAQVAAYQSGASMMAYFDRLDDSDFRMSRAVFLSDYVSFDRMDQAFTIASDFNTVKGNLLFVFWRADMAVFRSDPRFIDLIEAIGFIDYWDEYGWPSACARTGDGIRCH